ncbi:MAG: hypothetical protein WBD99_04075 [Thermodesulfobacteriota bacterium]
MKSLIAITLLITFMTTSSSIARSDEKLEPTLLAKAESEELSISKIADAHEKIKSNMESESIRNRYSDRGYSYNQDPQHSDALDSSDGSRDISLLIKYELDLERDLDLEYKAPRLKAEQLPLLMSSKDRKTKGAVFPPFLYLKKQF